MKIEELRKIEEACNAWLAFYCGERFPDAIQQSVPVGAVRSMLKQILKGKKP